MNQPGQRHSPPHQNKKKPNYQLPVFCVLLAVALLLTGALYWFMPKQAALPVGSTPESGTAMQSSSDIPASSGIVPYVPAPVGPYDEEGIPMLINRANPLEEGYVPPLEGVSGGYQMYPSAATALMAMIEAAAADGVNLWVVSGYRSHETQTINFNARVDRHMAEGLSYEEAYRAAARYVAVPGTSEHEAGLAVDLNSLYESFDQTPEYAWLAANCTRFGFIRRYRQNTEEITLIAYEPWHFRYVGTNHAAAIEQLGVTLEEYVAMMKGEEFTPQSIE